VSARVVGLVAGLVVLVAMTTLLSRRQLKEKYAVLWLAVSAVVAVLAVAPGLLDAVADAVGVRVPLNLLLVLGLLLLLLVCVHLSWETSRLEDETRALAEEVALLRLQLEEGPPPDPDTGA
jgi:hypothetical protein